MDVHVGEAADPQSVCDEASFEAAEEGAEAAFTAETENRSGGLPGSDCSTAVVGVVVQRTDSDEEHVEGVHETDDR